MSVVYAGVFHSHDPYANLAREEVIFDSLPEGARAVVLYVDAPSVIIGKHQNPWVETAVSLLSARNVPLLRRISGGGTVYHDLGNVNFSFMSPRGEFNREENLRCIVRALRSLGVAAGIAGTYDLYASGRKISGNSFCFRRNKAVHHGTILVSADRAAMRAYLAAVPLPIETHAVASRPAHTINLTEMDPDLTLDAVSEAVLSACRDREERRGAAEILSVRDLSIDERRVSALAQRNREWEWVYGRTPAFTVRLGRPGGSGRGLGAGAGGAAGVGDAAEGGGAEVAVEVARGHIARVRPEAETGLSSLLVGRRFEPAVLADAVEAAGIPVEWVRDARDVRDG